MTSNIYQGSVGEANDKAGGEGATENCRGPAINRPPPPTVAAV